MTAISRSFDLLFFVGVLHWGHLLRFLLFPLSCHLYSLRNFTLSFPFPLSHLLSTATVKIKPNYGFPWVLGVTDLQEGSRRVEKRVGEAFNTALVLTLEQNLLPKKAIPLSAIESEKLMGTLKEQLNSVTPALQEMQLRKEARLKRFKEVQEEIHIIA
ncbi:microtubule-associated protein 8 [Carex littledalei]|uniref:Microtubule-associated protein 8 n=1 Tax=Carex littledalei TaxID=544730 RepID=A0A833RAA1_9POAL|nr:microtubule-associated protein 8 [Carex littledalei]